MSEPKDIKIPAFTLHIPKIPRINGFARAAVVGLITALGLIETLKFLSWIAGVAITGDGPMAILITSCIAGGIMFIVTCASEDFKGNL